MWAPINDAFGQQSQKWVGKLSHFIRRDLCHSKALKPENQLANCGLRNGRPLFGKSGLSKP